MTGAASKPAGTDSTHVDSKGPFDEMTSPTTSRPADLPIAPTRLDTIPPEVRTIIYSHIELLLWVTFVGTLDVEAYPWQLSAVSRLLRSEFRPILHGVSLSHPLHLSCHNGRFPEEVRRRLPDRVLHSIGIITIQDRLLYDDIKPTLRTFPKLQELRLEMRLVLAPEAFSKDWCAGRIKSFILPETDLQALVEVVKRDRVLYTAAKLKDEQEMPREGLERDYFVEDTLYQTLRLERRRRGFDVRLDASLLSWKGHAEKIYWIGTLWVEEWDSVGGTFVFTRLKPA